ncbi:MAG: glycosyltransferase family 4 protein [Gemmatimonadota bacterium]|nr:glycosyltransferase family 4 protein [Gemmatimonadota bacterium]
MHVCLICVEIFAWGKYGGFGRSARMLGRELVKRGVRVTAVVPRRKGQAPVETLDGMTVLSFPPNRPWDAEALFRQADADIYHSQHPSYSTALALDAMPDRAHLITFRDPKFFRDMLIELRYPSQSHLKSLLAWGYESYRVRGAVHRATRVFACALDVGTKVRDGFALAANPDFLPSPIAVLAAVPRKSTRPTVCFVARWDRRKRPELFFELARARPDVRFVAVGRGQDTGYDAELRRRYGNLPNLEMPGFIDQFSGTALSDLLGQSWILANTAEREGLPTSFLEAFAHGCAILSRVNPDDLVRRFGEVVAVDAFADGLERLLANDAWRARGEGGRRYVHEHYELGNVVDRHLAVYREALHG